MDTGLTPLQKHYAGVDSPPSEAPQTGGLLANHYSGGSKLTKARSLIGNTDYNGWCEAFVEQTLGLPKLGGSAAEAWNNQLDKAVSGLSGIQPGDPIYFAPDRSNEGYGHTGIFTSGNKFISATDNGVKEYSIPEWQQITGQQLLGYIKQ